MAITTIRAVMTIMAKTLLEWSFTDRFWTSQSVLHHKATWLCGECNPRLMGLLCVGISDKGNYRCSVFGCIVFCPWCYFFFLQPLATPSRVWDSVENVNSGLTVVHVQYISSITFAQGAADLYWESDSAQKERSLRKYLALQINQNTTTRLPAEKCSAMPRNNDR